MSTLIVAESYFGNTRAITEAIAAGIGDDVTIVRPQDAPVDIPDDVELVLVGAPTHEFSMPNDSSRANAASRGSTTGDAVGVREWIANVAVRADVRVLTFDTGMKYPFMPGSAAKSACKALDRKGFHRAERGQHFWVTGLSGPLAAGEADRAHAWGERLRRDLRA